MKIRLFAILVTVALLAGCIRHEDEYDFHNLGMNVIEVTSHGTRSHNPEAAATYDQDMWQISYSTKLRIHNMMSHYKPVMSEREKPWNACKRATSGWR